MRIFYSVAKSLCACRRVVVAVIAAFVYALALLSAPAIAQTTIPANMAASVPGQCPAAEPEASAALKELRELGLKPGVKIDPATFMQDPAVAQAIADMTRRQQLRKQTDWSGLCRYRDANIAQLSQGVPQVVFLGDSITENWIFADPALFTEQVIDRGIGGQTSSQILLRFYPDVVALRPQVVHIMAGTNDILQNQGPVADDDIVNNISAMIDIALANDIKVVLASILPISVRSWQPELQPAQRLIRLNQRLTALAAARKVTFIDYFSALKDARDELHADLGNDGVHPNRAGYRLMKPLATQAIAQALR